MANKLTLTVEETVVKKAKSYAKQTGRSLSELVQSYLNTLVDQDMDRKDISSSLKKFIGAVKLPDDFDEKAELEQYMDGKHL